MRKIFMNTDSKAFNTVSIILISLFCTLIILGALNGLRKDATEPTVTTDAPTAVPTGELPATKPTVPVEKFQTITVKELMAKLDAKETFVVLFGFENCPYCRQAGPVLEEAAERVGQTIYFVDTRANPEWKSNMDIDDYELVVERFDRYIPLDDDGLKHLYVPHVFFVKDGEVVAQYQGIDESYTLEDPFEGAVRDKLAELYEHGFLHMLEIPHNET